MNLTDLTPKMTSEKLSEAYTVRFGKTVDVTALNKHAAESMLQEARAKIAEFKSSKKAHQRETSETYLKLMVMEQALAARVEESATETKVKVMNPKQKFMNAVKTVAVGNTLTESEVAELGVSAKLASVLESQKSAVKFVRAYVESCKSKKKGKKMMESAEVEQAQVVLAAQDMVDQVQKMIEQMTDLRVKELPALVDGIRAEMGTDQAGSFNDSANAALEGLLAGLESAKGELQGAVGIVTGEEMAVPGEEEMPAPDMDMEMPADDMAEPEMPELDVEEPEDAGDDLANLGRDRI
jgi:glutaredoxin